MNNQAIICTECPHCKEEIEFLVDRKILIGEEGVTDCPSCSKPFDYEIRVLTTSNETKTDEEQGEYAT